MFDGPIACAEPVYRPASSADAITHGLADGCSSIAVATRLAAGPVVAGAEVGVEAQGDADVGVAEPLAEHLR